MKHDHHIVPSHRGGSDDPSNIVTLTVTQHAMWHWAEYFLHGDEWDRIAARGLAGISSHEETVQASLQEAGRKTKRMGVGIHDPEASARGRQKIIDNKLGWLDPKSQSAAGKKAAEMGVGIHSPEQQKLSKERLAQYNKIKWRCLVTGKITTKGPLTLWQKARGIDTSLRELVG